MLCCVVHHYAQHVAVTVALAIAVAVAGLAVDVDRRRRVRTTSCCDLAAVAVSLSHIEQIGFASRDLLLGRSQQDSNKTREGWLCWRQSPANSRIL